MISKLGRFTPILNRCRIFGVGVLLAMLASCPPVTRPLEVIPGEWAFRFFDVSGSPTLQEPAFIELMQDGTTDPEPPDRSLTFTGTATWMQDAETFLMQHTKDANVTEYTGTVFAPTYMEGSLQQTAGGSVVGLWRATFVTR